MTGSAMKWNAESRRLILATRIWASLLGLPRNGWGSYSGPAATMVTLIMMDAILRKLPIREIWDSEERMTALRQLLDGVFHFSTRMGVLVPRTTS
jgi:hypothetical protein